MKKSEKILGAITGVVVLGWAGLTFLGGGDGSSTASQEQVDLLRQEYDARIEQIQLADEISRQYFMLVGQAEEKASVREDGSFRPDLDFQNQVADWCRDYGFPSPTLEKDDDEIRDVEDYRLVSITIRIEQGEYKNIAGLIKEFESRGLIIQEVDLQAQPDEVLIDADIMVGKIVENYLNQSSS